LFGGIEKDEEKISFRTAHVQAYVTLMMIITIIIIIIIIM
jgi:hypothetical protein